MSNSPRCQVPSHTSTLSHRQFPQGAPSTTSQRTLRARHETQARAARRFVIFCCAAAASADRLLDLSSPPFLGELALGEPGESSPAGVWECSGDML